MKTVCVVFALMLMTIGVSAAADEAPVVNNAPPPGTRIYTPADIPKLQMSKEQSEAQDRDEPEADVVVACQVGEGGVITGCAIIEETPEGYGFGIIFVRLCLEKAKIDPASDIVPGTWLRQKFIFRY